MGGGPQNQPLLEVLEGGCSGRWWFIEQSLEPTRTPQKPREPQDEKMLKTTPFIKRLPTRERLDYACNSSVSDLVDISAPIKKDLAPPPNSPQTPCRPPRPHPPRETPPLLGFSIKTDPPPLSRSPQTSPSPPPSRKKKSETSTRVIFPQSTGFLYSPANRSQNSFTPRQLILKFEEITGNVEKGDNDNSCLHLLEL